VGNGNNALPRPSSRPDNPGALISLNGTRRIQQYISYTIWNRRYRLACFHEIWSIELGEHFSDNFLSRAGLRAVSKVAPHIGTSACQLP
jgi:hypothetical protein